MKLYYFETPNPRRACAAAKHLASPVELVRLDLASGAGKAEEYLAINPNGKVPALSDGDTNVWEGYAIMLYLAQKTGSDFGPQTDQERVDMMQWGAWDLAHFSRHAGRLLWEHWVKSAFDLGETNPDEVEDATGFFKQFAGVLDDHLGGKDYVMGGRLTMLDFGIAAFLPSASDAKLPLDDFKQIQRWHDKLMALDAWREPWG
jgi:glutathione S-transferase